MAIEDGATVVMRFADVLLPGDAVFPSASASGMVGLLMVRLRGAGTLHDRLLGALAGPPDHASVARIEAAEPALFDEIRKIVYLTYYEQDSVVAAIRTLGMPYNWAPLPEGYAPDAFDPAIDAPTHQRGHWTPTGEVVRPARP